MSFLLPYFVQKDIVNIWWEGTFSSHSFTFTSHQQWQLVSSPFFTWQMIITSNLPVKREGALPFLLVSLAPRCWIGCVQVLFTGKLFHFSASMQQSVQMKSFSSDYLEVEVHNQMQGRTGRKSGGFSTQRRKEKYDDICIPFRS